METCTDCEHLRWHKDGTPVCSALGDAELVEEWCSDYDAPNGGLEPVPHADCPKLSDTPECPEERRYLAMVADEMAMSGRGRRN